jgi:BirA family transcriptional regulator, biotin operon repressor / biotin---[acetyl-CoA-carboxylase] ligase
MAQPVPILRYATIDSTNSEARRLSEQGETGPVWIVADEQTAGRGRLGRLWHSKSGNLYCTLLLSLNAAPDKAAQVSFIAALAVHDISTHFIKNPDITLKWPNDCLLGGAKFCGILSEFISQNPSLLALGIGMNIAHAPEGLTYPTTCLAAHAPQVTVQAAHEVLTTKVQHWLEIWDKGRNFTAIKNAWAARAHAIGQTLTVDLGSTIRQGQFQGLNDDGAMILRDCAGHQFIIHAGDVRITSPQEITTP